MFDRLIVHLILRGPLGPPVPVFGAVVFSDPGGTGLVPRVSVHADMFSLAWASWLGSGTSLSL